MKRFFTSDFHLNSALINKYAARPFRCAESALNGLIENCNQCAGEDDTVIHVGDFFLKGADRHGESEDRSCGVPFKDCVSRIKAHLVLLSGNHDDGHNCDTIGRCLLINISRHWRNVTVAHHPSYCKEYDGVYGRNGRFPHVHLCGHVHNSWLVLYDRQHNVLNVNVGVDAWNYKPVSDAELVSLLDYLKEHADFVRSDIRMSRSEFDKFEADTNRKRREERKSRKAERHLKLGLTPEECERRKLEALKRKGLVK